VITYNRPYAIDSVKKKGSRRLGCVRGGLAVVALLSCAFFTALTGASGITIVALGGLLLPALLEDRYPEDFSLGLLTSSGSLGLLFPPSLPMIIYGVVAGVSIPQLFLAGFIPGILLVVLLSIYSMYKGVRGECRVISFDLQEFIDTFRETIWEILLPVVVLGGIYSGFLAVSEAAVVTVVYVLLTNLQIGYSTPPIGMNLFIASLRFEKSVLRLGAASLPFLGILLVALLIITFVPSLSLLLVR
jgi:C4-dicarboxylate transporter DctM subunit